MAEGDDRLFRFAQFEFPWVLGPDPGRYVLRRRGDLDHILVLNTLGAPQRRFLRRSSRPRPAESEPPPEPVAISRVTVIDPQPTGRVEAERWLAALDAEAATEALDEAIVVINRAAAAHRAATADPAVRDVSWQQALVSRLGYGRGPQVADGRWAGAVEVPFDQRARQRRVDALRPQERLAAVLGGHDAVLACEELTLRARSDLDAGRHREAALQLRVALEAGIAELEQLRHPAGLDERVAELREQRPTVGSAANEALLGELPGPTRERVSHALSRLESALRTRALAGPPAPRSALPRSQ